MSWLEVQFDARTVVQPDGVVLYRVQVTALSSSGIEKEVFVFDTNTNAYEHVASVWEMESLPSSPGQASAQDANYYRASSMVRLHTTSKAASDLIADIKTRLSLLRTLWDEANSSPFGGVETVLFSSES
jgi:hypothetical protein